MQQPRSSSLKNANLLSFSCLKLTSVSLTLAKVISRTDRTRILATSSQSPSYGLPSTHTLVHPAQSDPSLMPSHRSHDALCLRGRELQSAQAVPGKSTQGLILLVWPQKQLLSTGTRGKCCFTSFSGKATSETPAKGPVSPALRCDIRMLSCSRL